MQSRLQQIYYSRAKFAVLVTLPLRYHLMLETRSFRYFDDWQLEPCARVLLGVEMVVIPSATLISSLTLLCGAISKSLLGVHRQKDIQSL